MSDWGNIKSEHIIEAIRKFDREHSKVPSSRTTFLKFEGKQYPAKHIRAMAYKIANGVEISKADFHGGIQTVKFFNDLGFDVMYNGELKAGLKNISNGEDVEDEDLSNVKIDDLKVKPVIWGFKKNADGKMCVADVSDSSIRNTPVAKANVKNNTKENKTITNVSQKIKITSKHVVEQKNAFQAVLNEFFEGDVICEKGYPWMKTPGADKDKIYKKLINDIHNYRGDSKFAKENYKLKCDFVCDSKRVIFEYDERQHFSMARKIALESYVDNVDMHYDAHLWIKACGDINAKDNSPVNRDEVRAFYDSVRDIEAAKNGYYLIRIMHGAFDWSSEGAVDYLKEILEDNNIILGPKRASRKTVIKNVRNKKSSLKVGLFLQDFTGNCVEEFNDIVVKRVKEEDLDLLVFPEWCYADFNNDISEDADITTRKGYDHIKYLCMDLSKYIRCPIIYSNCDCNGAIYSMYVNPFATDEETEDALYIKHTATSYYPFYENYRQLIDKNFPIINLKGANIGITICYDCNHSLFSRMYGVKGVDIIINSTGGNVNKTKWYRYNKTRALENNCYNLCTMGYDNNGSAGKSYTFVIGPCGKKLEPCKIIGDANENDVYNNVYVYDIDLNNKCDYEEDFTLDQMESINKNQTFFIDVNNIDKLLKKAKSIDNRIYILKHKEENIVIGILNDSEMIKPENVCNILYNEKLKRYENKRYLIINNWSNLDVTYYKNILSDILKSRAAENYIGVILNTPIYKKCYQSGKTKNVQLVQMVNGSFGMDTSRMGGPDTIWRAYKDGRKRYEILLDEIIKRA